MRGCLLGWLTVVLTFATGGMLLGFIVNGNVALGWGAVASGACAGLTLALWEARGG